MSIRAAATQLGIVAGGALGCVALAAGGYDRLGATLSALFAAGALPTWVRPGHCGGLGRLRPE